MLNLVQNLPTIAAQQLGLNDLQGINLQTLLLDQATPVLGGLAVSVGKELVAKFLPGFSVVNTVINAVTWLLNNQSRLTGVITTVLDGLGDLAAGNSQALQNNLVTAFDLAVPAALDFAAAQFGLDALPGRLQAALQVVPTKVDDVLNSLVKALVGKVKALLGLSPGAGTPLGNKVPISFQGQNYLVWAVLTSSGPRVVWSEANGTAVNQLTAAVVQGNATLTADLQAVLSAAQALANKLASLKQGAGSAGSTGSLSQLSGPQQALQGALQQLATDLAANGCGILQLGACFAAGTKLLTPLGWWPVEDLQEGMLVLSRPEDDPHAETRWQAVEATFVRTGRVLHLHVGGEVIRTTPEHPFYVFGKGWTAAGALQAGDWLSTLSGGWAAVEETYDTGCYETVYNVRVAEDHTYFVGGNGWTAGIWAHNRYIPVAEGHARAIIIRDPINGLNIGAGRTVAYAEVAIPGLPSEVVGYSGSFVNPGVNARWEQRNPGSVVAPPSGHVGGFHADAAVVDYIRTLLSTHPNATGVVSLYIDHPTGAGVCVDCASVILQFRTDFAGRVRLDVVAN